MVSPPLFHDTKVSGIHGILPEYPHLCYASKRYITHATNDAKWVFTHLVPSLRRRGLGVEQGGEGGKFGREVMGFRHTSGFPLHII